MKHLIFITLLTAFQHAFAGDSTGTALLNPNYDSVLAEQLGADDYGMKGYYFVLLKTGPNTSTDSTLIAESFRGHFENMGRMVKSHQLVLAGPFGRNEDQLRGLFILQNVNSKEQAMELLQGDAAIRNGFLLPEIYPWYGSAAIQEYLPYSEKIWKVKP